MAVASLGRVKRREKILVGLGALLALWVYRTVPLVTNSSAVDGATLSKPVFSLLQRLGRQFFGAWPMDAAAYSSAALGAVTCLLVYFIYRELFGQRYIGVAALALAGSAPAFVSAAAGETRVVGLFFIALAVYLWLKQRWILWGVALGLAFSSHLATATLIPPFVGWLIWSRGAGAKPRRLALGAALAVAPAAAFYYWALDGYGGIVRWWQGQQAIGLQSAAPLVLGLPQVALFAAYVAVVLFLLLRSKSVVRRAMVSIVVAGIPYTFLMIVGGAPFIRAVGTLMWAIALVAVVPLHISDDRKREITFLLVWVVPLLILITLAPQWSNELFVFAVIPLALVACRLLDLSVDGKWLDYWWALGLPSDWYYRLCKAIVLLVLALTFVEATRLRG